MTHPDAGEMEKALDRAHAHATAWLGSLDHRPVPARADADAVTEALGGDLPAGSSAAPDVVDLLAGAVEPGLVAMPSGRFFGFVIGGSHPAALAADWLVGAWDQNAVLRQVTPGVAAAEEVAGAWLLDLLGLPASSGVGFATGATTANLTGILAGRDTLLRRTGGRRWCCCRPGTCTRARATRSTRASRSPTSTTRGCTSTALSACGQPRLRRTGTSRRASRARTRGRPTPTRRLSLIHI